MKKLVKSSSVWLNDELPDERAEVCWHTYGFFIGFGLVTMAATLQGLLFFVEGGVCNRVFELNALKQASERGRCLGPLLRKPLFLELGAGG